MSKILIVGNVLKDIYLRLDDRKEEIERDADGVKWINWGFNSSSHDFFRRTSIYSGAVVTLEVLKKFGIEAEIFGDETKLDEDGIVPDEACATDYRYILQAEEQISYLVPSEKNATKFTAEKIHSEFNWIFVDRSAIFSQEMVENLLEFLKKNREVKLAIYAPKRIPPYVIELIERADWVFSDAKLKNAYPRGKVCLISETNITLDGAEVTFEKPKKTELLTHLTVYSVIAASIFGANLRGKSVSDSLLMAKINIENTKLNETVPFVTLEELAREEKNNGVNLRQMAAQLMTRGKGILAADESGGSIHKKFEAMGIPDDYQHRRDYRNLFFTTPGLEKYVNGVILFDETVRQKTDDGRNFVEFLAEKGIIPGIKVDQGLASFMGSEEKYTMGLEGLEDRLVEYYSMGLRFAKWRAAFEITETSPTKNAVLKNAEILAKYAAACQRAKIVPIIEPEVVYDGNFPIEKCAAMTGLILQKVFEEMEKQKVQLSGTILKVNMALAGKQYTKPSTPKEVGLWTARFLKRFVPANVGGVVFLSGGQTPEQATENLQAVTNNGPFPWPVTFSFARALQGPALEAWCGNNEKYPEAQAAFLERLKANCGALKKK